MHTLRKAWLTEISDEVFSLTLESDDPEVEWMQVHASSHTFPKEPSERHPLRHTLCISTLAQHDVNILAQALDIRRTDK